MFALPPVHVPDTFAVTPIDDWGYAHQDKGSPEAHVAVVARRLGVLLAGLQAVEFVVSAYKGREGLVTVLIGQGEPIAEAVEERGHMLARVCVPEPCSYAQWCRGQQDFARQVRLVTELYNALVRANPQLDRHRTKDMPDCVPTGA